MDIDVMAQEFHLCASKFAFGVIKDQAIVLKPLEEYFQMCYMFLLI